MSNVSNPEIGVGQYPPQSAQNQASNGASSYSDGSGHIFSMYFEMATEEDKKIFDNWKAEAKGIFLFTGLFSAAVAALITVSIQDLRQNPQDTSNFYLANMYQATISPNASSSLPTSPPPFSPPTYAIWVNALWLLSLVISLTCALLANFLQKWAQRYLKVTHTDYSPHKRARVRAFFFEGVVKSHLPWVFETLPTLLHVSLFLFFAGLVVFMANVNITIFKLVLSWVSLCAAIYGYITIDPVFRHDSPYYTPLSFPVWHIIIATLFFIYRFLRWFTGLVRFYNAYSLFRGLERSCYKSLVWGVQKTAEETAPTSPSEIDTRVFMWTFHSADEDHELERFFFGLPGFRSSNVVFDPLPSLTEEEKWTLYDGLRGLLDRTLSSDLLPAPIKNRRLLICAKAVDPEDMPDAFNILDRILSECQHSGPLAIGIAKIVTGYEHNMDDDKAVYARLTFSQIITKMQPHDDSWYKIVSNELGCPETSLRNYATQGDNLSLVILIHVVRQQFTHFRSPYWDKYVFAHVLATASKFNVNDTSPEWQHVFCTLWNEIVREAQVHDREMAFFILGQIRNVFLALHRDTDSAPTRFSTTTGDVNHILHNPSSFPVCTVPDHHSHSTPHFHVRSLPIHDPPLSGSTHAPLLVDEIPTEAPPVDNNVILPVQTTSEGSVIPSSPSPVTSRAIHGRIDNHPRTMRLSVSETSTSGLPPNSNASPSSPDKVPVRRTELGHAPSDDRTFNVRSSPYPTPLRHVTLPTDSHLSILEAAAEGEGSAKAGLSREEDATYSTLCVSEDISPALDTPQLPAQLPVPHNDIMVTSDIPTQLPPPQPIANEVVAGPSSQSSLDMGGFPSLPHGQYDIM